MLRRGFLQVRATLTICTQETGSQKASELKAEVASQKAEVASQRAEETKVVCSCGGGSILRKTKTPLPHVVCTQEIVSQQAAEPAGGKIPEVAAVAKETDLSARGLNTNFPSI